MNLTNGRIKANIPHKKNLKGLPQDMLKGLCFNCDHRKTCTWKDNRKLFCEHFQ